MQIILDYLTDSTTFKQAKNDGILTIATTNHAERIDDAILNRPSRFDVKYDYALPSRELRQAFTSKWLEKVTSLDAPASIIFESPHDIIAADVAEKTNGWSFAFMKELYAKLQFQLQTFTNLHPLPVSYLSYSKLLTTGPFNGQTHRWIRSSISRSYSFLRRSLGRRN